MPTASYSFSFAVGGNPACWAGSLSRFELKLLHRFPVYALEQLRTRFLYAVTTTHDSLVGARAIAQMAFETEIGTAIAKVVSLPPDVFTSNLCERRTYLEIDADMELFNFLLNPALVGVLDSGFLPESYVRLFKTHLSRPYAKYRMCAIAALLCMSAQYLIPDTPNAYEFTFADTVSMADDRAANPGFIRNVTDTVSVAEAVVLLTDGHVADTISVVDAAALEHGYGRSFSDTVGGADTYEVVRTEIAYWRDQARPVSVVVDPDFRSPVQVWGVDDSEIYLTGGVAADAQAWKWNGSTWSVLTNYSGSYSAKRIWGNRDGSQLYLFDTFASSGGIFKSIDHGATWSGLPSFGATGNGFHGYEAPDGSITLYASQNQGGIVKTVNDGGTWTSVLGLSVLGGDFNEVIYAIDNTHVYFGGFYSGGALLWFYNGTTVTQITSVIAAMGAGGSVRSAWASDRSNIFLGGYRTAGNDGILLRTQDAFATSPNVETLPSFGALFKNYIDAISGVSASEIYATLQVNSRPQVMRFDGATWADDSAVQNNLEDAVGLWVNPATKRGVLLTHKGELQVNRNVAAGRYIELSFDDTASTSDARTIV